MCGINGFTFQDSDALRRMHSATRHRGPDDEGFFEAPGISLAHNRLSIIDLSPAGHQPMRSADGRYTIVFNGEIYNYADLRRTLEGMGEKFVSQSDTEVLLHAYMRWGKTCLPKLNGIFAFALWDAERAELFLARDQMGVKPLYYHRDGARLIFSSELKAILEHGVRRDIDREAMNTYFRLLYVPGERTMIQGIRKLRPGHSATFRQGDFSIERWWMVEEGERIRSYDEAVERVRDLTVQAVRRQLVSDRPLGVFLSGGIDSTAVLGIMRHLNSGGEIKTFTMGYEPTPQAERYNADARIAARTAAHFSTDHHTFTMSADDAMTHLEEIAWHMDEPISNHAQSSTFLLARFAKPSITVALGGDGGDELFGGYPRYWYSAMIDRLQSLPIGLRTRVATSLAERVDRGRGSIVRFTIPPGLRRHLSFVAQKEDLVRSFLSPAVTIAGSAERCLEPFFSPAWKDATNQLMAVDAQTWIPDESLQRTDRLTMASGLEERVPLLDPELVAYAFRVPSKWKIGSRQQGKRIFIDAMKPFLPVHVLTEEKRAWMSPAAKLIRGPLLPFVREVLSASYCSHTSNYFDFPALQRILEDHVSVRRYALNTIWSVLTFQLWAKRFLR